MLIIGINIHAYISTIFISDIFINQRCIDFPNVIKDIERNVTEEKSCQTRILAQTTQDARDAVKVLCLAER